MVLERTSISRAQRKVFRKVADQLISCVIEGAGFGQEEEMSGP
jgi:hypothetical protein